MSYFSEISYLGVPNYNLIEGQSLWICLLIDYIIIWHGVILINVSLAMLFAIPGRTYNIGNLTENLMIEESDDAAKNQDRRDFLAKWYDKPQE